MNKTILIVEDEFIVADDLQLTLEQAGYNVCGIAASVVEAREMIRKKNPGLVLLDIHLKGKVNGIELAKELNEENIAFVYLSANSNQPILEAAKATEPYGFLVKPFRDKDLLVTLDIAFFRHEHSLQARWHREVKLQKELAAIQKESGTFDQKLVRTAKALQAHLPFDCLAGKFKMEESKHISGFAFLRIGYEEYQKIGPEELSVISGLKPEEIQKLFTSNAVDNAAACYNGNEFSASFAANPLKALFATVFNFSSNLLLPLLTSDGYIFSLSFYSRSTQGYTSEQLEWISRLQQPLTAILNSIPTSDKSNLLSTGMGVAREKNEQAVKMNSPFAGIIGNSAPLLSVLDLLSLVAPLDTSVLILGESGTGKERIADSIHRLSPRKNKPLIKINCAALPSSLIESELFGHEKGSFTGAFEKKTGKFELADKGTIFLDEIGEMPADLQVKLLRVLQEREIERIGGHQTIKIDVRVIAATNRNLENEMAEGRFRLDLYYRLTTFPITLPPLRERKEDIRPLAYFFVEKFSKRYNKSVQKISEQMLSQLEDYSWPGNIRELENIIEQSLILNDGRPELSLQLPLSEKIRTGINHFEDVSTPGPLKTIADIKRMQRQTAIDHISSVLKKTGGRIRGKNGAAELLNEKPTTLESRMAKLGIKKEDFF